MEKLKKILALVVRISISFILLVLLFKFNKIDLGLLLEDIQGANKIFLGLGFLTFFFCYGLGFLRWQMLLKVSHIQIPFKKLLCSFSGGVFFSIFLPSTIGGDLVRTTDLASHTNKAKSVIASVFLDRLSGYIGLVLVVLPAVLFSQNLINDRVVYLSVGSIILILVLILLVLFNNFIYSKIKKFLSLPGAGKIKEKIKDLHYEIHLFRNHKQVIITNLLLSFIIQIIMPLSVYFIALALGIKIKFIYFLIFLPIISAITLIPISLGGLGLRESLFVVYFAKAGVIKQLALAMSLLSFSFVVLYGAIGGLIYVLTVHRRCVQPHQPSAV